MTSRSNTFLRNLHVVDFETDEIQARPEYPPAPAGVSIRYPSGKSVYYAWNHPAENNATKSQVRKILADIWRKENIAFYNAKFDLEVAEKWFELALPPWHRVHDAMFLAFLNDPHARSLELKEVADDLLGMPAKEQQAVRQWLIDQKIVKAKDSKWGRCIAKAPGKLVGKYAIGDTTRTYKLFKMLHKHANEQGMLEAYDRECQLIPIMLANEQRGMLVNHNLLEKDIKVYEREFLKVDAYLRKRLKVPLSVDPVEELNLDADAQVAKRLNHLKIVTDWTLTKTGKLSMAKKNLSISMFHDKKVALAYAYRTRLQTCLGTFMRSYLETSHKTGGRIHTVWNQVRQADNFGGGFVGARTGRFSSTPNFMNIPTSFEEKDDGYEHPKYPANIIALPMIRRYILPEKGHVFAQRDYDQQELRILAYYEDADLYQAYLADPALDIHAYVQTLLRDVGGMDLQRKAVKIINFGMIYGMGIAKLADSLGVPEDKAREIKSAHRASLPGVEALERDLKEIGRNGECITTWGGRQYYKEEGKIIDGWERDFSYKLLNYLIQGSAADNTKQALINYDDIQRAENSEAFFQVTVHDEVNSSIPKGDKVREMKLLKTAMEDVDFEDIIMASSGNIGPNWHDVKKFRVEGDLKK